MPESARPDEGSLPLVSDFPNACGKSVSDLSEVWTKTATNPDKVSASVPVASRGMLLLSPPLESRLAPLACFVFGPHLLADVLPPQAVAPSQSGLSLDMRI